MSYDVRVDAVQSTSSLRGRSGKGVPWGLSEMEAVSQAQEVIYDFFWEVNSTPLGGILVDCFRVCEALDISVEIWQVFWGL
jgi:hypothetical protein